MDRLSSSFDMEISAYVSLKVVHEALRAVWILFAVMSPVINLTAPVMEFLESQHGQKLNDYSASVNLHFMRWQLDK